MEPIGPLMWEHRTIERVIGIFDSQILRMRQGHAIDIPFIDTAVDFIRTYADRTYHGKEEDILFRDLAGKDLSEEHARIMAELIEEHTFARATTRKLVAARDRYVIGGSASPKSSYPCSAPSQIFTRSTSRRRIRTSSFQQWSISRKKRRMRCSGSFTSSTGR
ncbi:MAG: hypothetical protein QCH35_00690 [Methanomicrobiaceae archaeon]|nr:hypothetical protein [Methanomicrobiaceae archaeon]